VVRSRKGFLRVPVRSCFKPKPFTGSEDLAGSSLFGIDDSQSLDQGDVTKPLVGADKLSDRDGLLYRQGHRELNCVEGVDLPRLPTLGDEIAA
jgi:hypothetical protein